MDWAHRTEEVPRITTAGRSPKEELAHRQRRYVLSMTIRTLCFIGAVFARSIPWLCIILIIASFVLPYVAVVMANSVSPVIPGDPVDGPGNDHKELR
ncbi:MAG TPA: DUF3099 domain-containing protein [Marmoricola sp.]